MRQPITWKNIQAPNLTGVAQINNLASQQLNQAFDSAKDVGKIFGDRAQRGVDLNTQHFEDQLRRQYQTPEALREAQASGAIDQLRQSYDQLGQNTGANFIDGLVSDSQTRVTNDQIFADNRDTVADRDVQARIQERLFAGDNEGAARLAQEANAAGTFSDKGLTASLASIDAEQGRDKLARRGDYAFNQTVAANQRAAETRAKDERTAAWERKQSILLANGDLEALEAHNASDDNPNPGASITSLKDLKAARYAKELVDEIANGMVTERGKNRTVAQQQNAWEADTGLSLSVLNDKNVNKLNKSQLNSLLALSIENDGVGRESKETSVALEELRRRVMKEQGINYEEASIAVDGIYTRAKQATGVSGVVQQERDAELQAIKNQYSNISLVTNNVRDMTGNRLEKIMGDKYGSISEMTGAARQSYNDLARYINLGYIPKEDLGSDRDIPLSEDIAKFIAGTSGGKSSMWDFFAVTPDKRINEIKKAGLVTDEMIAGYETYKAETTAAQRRHRIESNPQQETVNLPGETAIRNALDNEQLPADTPDVLEAPVNAITDETVPGVQALQQKAISLQQEVAQKRTAGDFSGADKLMQEAKNTAAAVESKLEVSSIEKEISRIENVQIPNVLKHYATQLADPKNHPDYKFLLREVKRRKKAIEAIKASVK